MPPRLASAVLVTATIVVPAMARADDCPSTSSSACVDSDEAWSRPGSTPYSMLPSGITTPEGQVSFGLTLSYLRRPIVLHASAPDPTNGRDVFIVDHALNGSFLFALGVTNRLELTVAAPMTFYQDGEGLGFFSGSTEELRRSAIRDPRFGLAFAFLEHPRADLDRGLSLVGRLEFVAPFASDDAFAGSRTATLVPSLAADLALGRLAVTAEIGARLRGASMIADVSMGSQFIGALGVNVRVWDAARLVLGAEAIALPVLASPAEGRDPVVPAEWAADVSVAPWLGGDLSLGVSGGGAIPFTDASVGAPLYRFGFSARYAPRGSDRDSDGILDRNDKCVDKAEDRDGFKDDDGCPDPDNDEDTITDERDRCRDEAEDMDGHDDGDGCLDPDDDGDTILDADDQCRGEKEDRDGFKDDDGCPDPDNDGDGIPDGTDTCPTAKEDIDGVRDTDGCPDLDDDNDGVPDATDRCPKQAEDKDGINDDDGCPDLDEDQDGVLDGADKCNDAAETIDGTADDDGCPEAGAKSRVRWVGSRVEIDDEPSFPAGKATVSDAMGRVLRMVAQLVKGKGPNVVIIVEAYPDKRTDTSPAGEDLAVRRAAAVRDVLAKAGLPTDRITAAAGDPAAPPELAPRGLTISVQPVQP